MSYLADNLPKVPLWLRARGYVRFFLNRALWEVGYPWTRLRPERLEAIFPGIGDANGALQVAAPFDRQRGTSMEVDELLALLAIERAIGARRVVEVGTFDGNTALNLALNLAGDGCVVTLDLPPEGDVQAASDPASAYAGGKPAPFTRRQYVGHPAATHIRQVLGDSARLDWTTFGGPFDLAYIDGDHSSAYVASDTRKTLGVLRPGGVIAWHDYEWRSVAAVLDAAAARGAPIRWVQGTRLAVATFADPAAALGWFAE